MALQLCQSLMQTTNNSIKNMLIYRKQHVDNIGPYFQHRWRYISARLPDHYCQEDNLQAWEITQNRMCTTIQDQ